MAQIDVLKAQIVRNELATPWGFRLQGGAEQGQAISIMRVTPGSPASRIGVKSGDEVTHISNRCTKHMSLQQAHDLITQHTQTLVLTLERRAEGTVPTNPLLTPPPEAEPPGEPQTSYQPPHDTYASAPAPAPVAPHYPQPPQQKPDDETPTEVTIIRVMNPPRPLTPPTPPKFYQPFAFNRPTPQGSAPVIPKKYVFQKAQSRPFTAPPSGPRYQAASPPISPPQDYQTSPQHKAPQYYDPPDISEDSDVSQSRTFKSLQSLMRNDEPAAGVPGLPPPRSAYMERTKYEEAQRQRQAAGQQRVKVFMPQQYNSPISMYSAKNVVDSFQNQAEGYYDQQESAQIPQNISNQNAHGVSEL